MTTEQAAKLVRDLKYAMVPNVDPYNVLAALDHQKKILQKIRSIFFADPLACIRMVRLMESATMEVRNELFFILQEDCPNV